MPNTDLDIDSLRKKYREERDKRLAVEARKGSTPVRGDLAERYDSDPWVKTDLARDPVSREVEALIVGGGIGGMLAGGNLRKHGVPADQICIVERGADFGGTWYWNRYPGLSCDTESYCYLPLLEETGYVPKEKYAKGPELFEHSQRVGRHFGLYDQALFQTCVTEAVWSEELLRWIVRTDRGDEIRARYLWLCGGATNRPKLPALPGITDFRGHSFHTMRWDYDYTGGGPEGGMTKLKDKRVGVIGTGCTAIQCVPPLAEAAKELFVFQRTPSAINVRANRPTDPDWAAGLEPGWQMARMENFLDILSGLRPEIDLVDDGWTRSFRNVTHYRDEHSSKLPDDVLEQIDFEVMERVRQRVDEVVTDPATAEALKPWYGLLCKRPTFHDGYLDTFNRANVTLVDTSGQGVERVTENGLIANGREYPLDCIIFATGFDLNQGVIDGWGFDPVGVGGTTLSQRWAREFSTLHGMHISGFPNMFAIGGSQGTLATTRTYDLSVQTEHCAGIVEHCRKRGIKRIEVKPEAEQAWLADMADSRLDLKAYFQECTPGYFNREGQGGPVWDYYHGGGPVQYRRILEAWASEGLSRDMELTA